MRALFYLAIFLFIGALLVISNGNLHLKDKAQAKEFLDQYYLWILDVFRNVKGLSAYAVSHNWVPSAYAGNSSEAVE